MKRLVPLVFAVGLLSCAQDEYQAQRERMVREQMENRDIRNREVLRAIRAVPRHLFVPPNLRSMAYADHPVPIGYSQTISQPYIVALMTQMLEPEKGHKALEIGTGSGYQAAVLSPLVKQVYTIEIVPELARSAGALLMQLGCKNVMVKQGDGYRGWPEEAPFDRIILTAAPPEVPQALLDQLKPGGRLVAPVGGSVFGQELVMIDKGADGKIRRNPGIPVRFVPMVRGEK